MKKTPEDKAIQKQFDDACINDDTITIMKLFSNDSKSYPNIHNKDDNAIKWACENNNLELIKFFLTSPQLKEHANFHASEDTPFRILMACGYVDIIEYLIFDYGIRLTEHIKKALDGEREILDLYYIDNMFAKRELHELLQSNLKVNIDNITKIKC